MQVKVSGKQIDVGEAFQEYVEDQLGLVVGKYFDRSIEASVTMSRSGHGVRADIAVHVSRGFVVQSHGEAEQAHPAFDVAMERAAKRLRRHKRRLKDHNRKERAQAKLESLNVQRYIIAAPTEPEGDDPDSVGDNPVVIAEMTKEIETLSVSDAVMRMDLADRAVFVFRNAGNGELNVVYRRRDGNIGWIDPQTEETSA